MSKRILDQPYRVLVDMTKVKPSETAEIEILRGTESITKFSVKGGKHTSIRVGRPDGGDATVSPSKKVLSS